MTKKDLQIAYEVQCAEIQSLEAELQSRDTTIFDLRYTLHLNNQELGAKTRTFNYYQDQFLIHQKVKDEKIEEQRVLIAALESKVSALESLKIPEELTGQIETKDREIKRLEDKITDLEARIAEYANIHKVNAYGLCALKELERNEENNWR